MTSSFTVKMMFGSHSPVTGSNAAKVPATTSVKPPALPLQVSVKELQKLETPEKISKNVSRRDLALFLTATSFATVALSSPKPAQAQISKAGIKKMLVEKLKMLSEKLGLSKPEPAEIEKNTTPPPPIIAGKKAQSSPSLPKADKEIQSTLAPPTTENKGHSSPAPPIAENKVHVPQEPRLPSIQNDKKVVVEAATFP